MRVWLRFLLRYFSYPNTHKASFDSIVRRPGDDRISRSKHVASYTINNNKKIVLGIYVN